MKSLKTLITGLALLGSVSLALLAPAAAGAASRVIYKDTSSCVSARVGHVSCLAIKRTVFVNGIRQHSLTPMTGTTFGAPALRKAYGINALGLRSKVIAIVDAEHSGSAFSDLVAYRQMYGIQDITNCGTNGQPLTALPTGKDTCFVQMDQDGNVDQSPTTTDQGWAQEIALDIEMASAICPHCSILLVEARSSSFADLNSAVATAAGFKGVVAISNSYGGPDVNESKQPAYRAASDQGIAVVASSGDNGYGVSAPASFSTVIGVGGTALYTSPAMRWNQENAWSNGGSGCSMLNPPALWQDTNVTDCAGKSVVDVSAVADPATGVAVTVDGQWYSFGGTSAAAPIIAALFGMKNNFGGSAGAYLWTNRGALHDVSAGANGRCQTKIYCNAGTGYDGPTGWGTPAGSGAF
jgi:subtilase family serine protease